MDSLEQLIKEYDLKIMRGSEVLSIDKLEKLLMCQKEAQLNEKRCEYIMSSGKRCKKEKTSCSHPKQFFKIPPVELECT